MLNSTVINIKTDDKVKKQAQKIAADLGLSLSGVINGFLKQFVRNKSVFFSMKEDVPSAYLLSCIEESKKDRKNKSHLSFKNNQDALDFLDKK